LALLRLNLSSMPKGKRSWHKTQRYVWCSPFYKMKENFWVPNRCVCMPTSLPRLLLVMETGCTLVLYCTVLYCTVMYCINSADWQWPTGSRAYFWWQRTEEWGTM
jgi:hypothetical protein